MNYIFHEDKVEVISILELYYRLLKVIYYRIFKFNKCKIKIYAYSHGIIVYDLTVCTDYEKYLKIYNLLYMRGLK